MNQQTAIDANGSGERATAKQTYQEAMETLAFVRANRPSIEQILARKLPCFPVRLRWNEKKQKLDKIPLIKNWQTDPPRTEAAIRAAFARRRWDIVGIPTGAISGIDALDVDPRYGGDKWYIENDERIPDTYAHITQSGGAHLLFAHADGVRNSAGMVARGIDIRGDGGFVVDWSLSGYRVLNRDAPSSWPDWLLPLVQKATARGNGAHAATDGRAESVRPNGSLIGDMQGPPPAWSEAEEARVRSALAVLPADERDGDWLHRGMEIHSLGWGERGYTIWAEWSKKREDLFDEDDQRETWESFDRGYEGRSRTIASLVYEARARGWVDPNPGGASSGDAELDGELARLAALPAAQYERERKKFAKEQGVRTSVLDKLVAERRPDDTDYADGQGRALRLVEPDPWPTAVDGAQLLRDLTGAVLRYVVLPKEAAVIVALWVLHTYLYDLFTVTPRLCITAPEKRCGKTTLLDVISKLVPRALATVNITPAAIFRIIELVWPTLMIDEVDNLFGRSAGNAGDQSRELLAILNSGHRVGEQTIRNVPVGDGYEPRAFSTFCPVVVALIGRLPSTLEDRSIVVELQRRLTGERVERLRADHADDLHTLARQARRWAEDNRSRLADCDPELPPELFNRVADNWRPLIAIADVIGGLWPQIARVVAIKSVERSEDDALRSMLLADIRTIFAERHTDRLLSDQIIEGLTVMESRPWADYRRGQPINKKQLATLLRPFKIEPDPNPFEVEETRSMIEGLRQERTATRPWLPSRRLRRCLRALPAPGERGLKKCRRRPALYPHFDPCIRAYGWERSTFFKFDPCKDAPSCTDRFFKKCL